MGASSRVITRRASLAVSSTSKPGQGGPARCAKWRRKPTSNGALWATSTRAARRTPGRPGARTRSDGASATIELVMPVRTAMNGGIAAWGLTRVWNSPSTSPPRTLTAPISVIMRTGRRRAAGRLQVDHAERDVAQRPPSSSKLRWASHREGAAAAVLMSHDARADHRQSPGRRATTLDSAVTYRLPWPHPPLALRRLRQPHPLRRHAHSAYDRVLALRPGRRPRGGVDRGEGRVRGVGVVPLVRA